MTDLKDLLTSVADRAAPIDDLADRAVAGSIRRRRRAMIAVPLAAAALAAAAVLVPGQLSNRGLEPVGPTSTPTSGPGRQTSQVEIRTADQPGLPGKLDQKALFAYAVSCDSGRCTSPWRLVTADGRQWNIPGATGYARDNGVVSVSPNGRRIAYLTAHDGSTFLAVRDLASGAIDEPLEFREAIAEEQSPSILWSPNGQWIGIDFPNQDDTGVLRATLVDTTTMSSRRLPYQCCLAGLPGAASWVAMTQGGGQLLRIDQMGKLIGEVPVVSGEFTADDAWSEALVSQDGSVVASIRQPDSAAELDIVDVKSGAVNTRLSLTGLRRSADTRFELEGWTGPHTVLVRGAEQVYAVDTRDGKARLLYEFSGEPERLNLATRVVAGGTP